MCSILKGVLYLGAELLTEKRGLRMFKITSFQGRDKCPALLNSGEFFRSSEQDDTYA